MVKDFTIIKFCMYCGIIKIPGMYNESVVFHKEYCCNEPVCITAYNLEMEKIWCENRATRARKFYAENRERRLKKIKEYDKQNRELKLIQKRNYTKLKKIQQRKELGFTTYAGEDINIAEQRTKDSIAEHLIIESRENYNRKHLELRKARLKQSQDYYYNKSKEKKNRTKKEKENN